MAKNPQDFLLELPPSVTINHQKWKVTKDPEAKADEDDDTEVQPIWGLCRIFPDREIVIGKLAIQANGRRELVATLLHEIIHAFRETYGYAYGVKHKDDERMVRALEQQVLDLVLANPQLMRLLGNISHLK